MPPFSYHAGAFDPRRDRSLGWPYLESRQAAALAEQLSEREGSAAALLAEGDGSAPGAAAEPPRGKSSAAPASTSSALALPPPLAPFPRRLSRPWSLARIGRALLAAAIAAQAMYMASTLLLILAYRFVDPPATVLMAYRKWGYGWRIEPPARLRLKRVPSFVRSMLVSVEDGKFYEHHGLDFEAFARASEVNAKIGRPLYGGSTLTMQVARTLFLVPEKSYLRKYLEIVAALEIELVLPKARILELYFDYAEWGKGLFGLEAAARRWYGAGAVALTREEAARLVALLSSPVKYGPATLERSAILRERYRYLAARYGAEGAAGDAGAAEVPAAPAGNERGEGLAPPPSTEPEQVPAEGPESEDVTAPPAGPAAPAVAPPSPPAASDAGSAAL